MEMITSRFKTKKLLLLTSFVVIINLVAVGTADLAIIRLTRLASMAIFIAYYLLCSPQRSPIVLLILTSLLARDIAVIFYETTMGNKLYLILGAVVYAALCLERSNVLKMISKDKSALSFTLIFIILNTLALTEITRLVDLGFHGPFEPYLFYVYGVFMIIFGSTAIMYNQVYNSNRSFAYILFMICFLISDVTSLFAYYFGYDMLFYIDRALYAVGLGLFTYTITETRSQLEETEQYEMLS